MHNQPSQTPIAAGRKLLYNKHMKRLLLYILLLSALLLCGCGAAVDESRTTVQGTIEGFVSAIAAGDYERADSYFVRDELLKGFRPDLLTTQYSTSLRAEQLVEMFDSDFFSYIMAWPYYTGRLDTARMLTAGPYRDITKSLLETYDYSSLKILDLGTPLQATQQDYFQMYTARATIYGADDVLERIALTEFQGRTYLTGYVLVRYKKQWGIFSLTAPAADMLGKPAVFPITESEYLQYYKEK